MAQNAFIYIDQNILQYDFENQLKLPILSDIEWVYSDEHFNEINRQENTQFFEVIERAKARKIKLKLNDKFEITNDAIIYEYQDPKSMYDEYITTIEKYKTSLSIFPSLLPFFFGNTESIDPKQFVEKFKSSTFSLLGNLPQEIKSNIVFQKLEEQIDAIAAQLESTLLNAKSQIKSLDKTRKHFSNKQFSNLEEKNGPIMEQIWSEIGDKLPAMTKDQFFGKELLPFYQPNNTNRSQVLFLGIAQCHTVLNFLGYWPDEGLPRESKIFGINSDAAHIAHSYFCSGIMSADFRLCQKTKAIYEYFGKQKNVFLFKPK